jgi:hypothetical protein
LSRLELVVELVKNTPKWIDDLARTPKWLNDLANWLDPMAPMLARAIKPAYEFGSGLLVGGVIALLLIVVVTKFGARMFGQFVKRDEFPVVMAAIGFVFPTVSVIALMKTHGVLPQLGGLPAGMLTAMQMHKEAVDRRDYMRKKDLPADKPPEALPSADVGGGPTD